MTKPVNGETKVTFTCRMNIVGSGTKETFTLNDLGWSDQQGKELSEFLSECFEDWLFNTIDSGWYLVE